MTGPAVHACPAWHLDYERGFAYVRFPLRSWLAGMRLSNEPISNETLLLRVALGDPTGEYYETRSSVLS
jgi:hypothetical protein